MRKTDACELVLFGLHDERKPGVIGKQRVIQSCNPSPLDPVPEFKVTGHQARGNEFIKDSQAVDHLKGRGVGGGRSRVGVDCGRLLVQGHAKALL